MKNFILLTVLLLAFSACTSNNEKLQLDNIEIVKRYVSAVENLDYEAMGALLADDYLGVGPSYGDSIRRDEAIANWKWTVDNLYEKITYNRQRFAAVTIPDGDNKGEWVANWADLTVVFKDGRSVTILTNSNYRIESGKIKNSLTFYNEADVQRQLGFVMVPEELLE
ncbi:MAG: nuclear transport factor 2 family protein [Cyclobacteriaceae bacterium]|nr:nuclear transport factor 2 family protein [Cyclobacteriaceae bacterium]